MSWWGKFIGGAVGFTMGGPLGLLIGGIIGHKLVDKPMQQGIKGDSGDHELTQAAFFSATFSIMGHIAKADGRVSEDEIAMARQIMDHMQLNQEQKRAAIDLFDQGKEADFDLNGVLSQFRQTVHRRTTLLQMFLEIQLHAAYADGEMHAAEKSILLNIAQKLGFSAAQFDQLSALVSSNLGLDGNRYYGGNATQKSTEELLIEAYEMLGVNPTASDAEVKKAYRRMMNQHHPDKLVAKGLPEEMMQMATEKTQQIKAAYELIKNNR